MTTTHLDDLGAFVALLRSQVIPADRLAGYAEEVGSATELVQLLQSGELLPADGSLPLGVLPQEQLDAAQRDADEWRRHGLDARTVFDSAYPTNLLEVANRPPFVFVRGQWKDVGDSCAVAIVGTRQASADGLRRAARLAEVVARAEVTVVSGLALGIDSAAHRAALKVGGRTSAVLGHGINRMYPSENAALAAEIAHGAGALISQFLPDQPPTKWTFPKRNVVMSGLSWITVVVEASWTSGARIQATEALRHGRVVFLLRSLVESHEWARKYVEEGRFDTRALVLDHPEQLLDALSIARAA
jgi:DNA processing protein